jgi:threonine synthase
VFLATAHPAKFREVVEPAIGERVALPPTLGEALERPRHSVRLEANYPALVDLVLS